MATGLVRTDDPCLSWGESIVEAVSEKTNRVVRWRGIDFVVRPNDRAPMDAVHSLRSNDSPLFLPEELADTVRRHAAGAPKRGDAERLVEATGHTMSQSAGLSSELFDNIGGIYEQEADLDAGLADVWAQERLAELWPKTESGRFVPAGEVRDFAFAGRNPAAAAAARELMTEIVRQQGPGAPIGPEDYAALSEALIKEKPEERFGEILKLLPGTDELSPSDRFSAEAALRRGFSEAVATGDPSRAAAAVRRASERIDPQLRRLADDPALAPVTPGRTPDSAGASVRPQRAGGHDVRRSPRSDRDRGGRH
ncbi:hypothetical protein [Kribbella sindirgiensis]|uniref:Uncharacterized protein n=1 Tax=Kribbella sindirgiensis TaxID=1124744 RepID=A0A4R0J1Z0_9ACTN|nr:hypothetical protein [Kribbella sindirgiensis]TCC35155.1 hypothetical protein E0H50_14945 [Kribbella sindirgiensis]